MKILITGITGLLGWQIGKYLSYSNKNDIYSLGRENFFHPKITYTKMHLEDVEALKKYLMRIQPDIIIHCAAATDMNYCENNFIYAELINVTVTKILAQHGCRIIYISSDGIFDGLKGNYAETDAVSPVNVYGYTKWKGEECVIKYNNNSVVLRASMYGFKLKGRFSWAQWAANCIFQGKAIKGLVDVKNNPLYTTQIVEVIRKLLMEDYTGILNLGCKETVSRYQFFIRLAQVMKKDTDLIYPAIIDDLNFTENRSKDSSLDASKLEKMGISFSLDEGIKGFYDDYIRWLD